MTDSTKTIISTPTSPIRAVAGSLALAGYTLALLAGFSAGNNIEEILARAFVSLLGCLLIGVIVARICESVVNNFLADYSQQHPIPNSDVAVQYLACQTQTEREQGGATSKKVKIENKNRE